MIVTILSAFRNSVGPQIERYFAQINALATLLENMGDKLTLVLGYGDSTDGTGEALFEAAADSIGAILIDVSHGGPVFGSFEHPQRFKQLAYVGNKLLDNIPPDADYVAIVESDLIWEASMLSFLLLGVKVYVPAAAPMVMDAPPANTFYDTFAFRRYGQRFTKEPPYAPPARSGNLFSKHLPLDSAGSVLVMNAELARQVRFSEEEVIVGLCKDIYRVGGSVWLDPDATVYHP